MEHMEQIVEVLVRGLEVFEDNVKLTEWLKHHSKAQGGKTPLSMLSSRYGTEMLLDELGRIKAGVYWQ